MSKVNPQSEDSFEGEAVRSSWQDYDEGPL
jgi:hypothetical protein